MIVIVGGGDGGDATSFTYELALGSCMSMTLLFVDRHTQSYGLSL